MLKNIIKQIIPRRLYRLIMLYYYSFVYAKYDMKRMLNNNRGVVDTENRLIGVIIQGYHGIEKGLTMPNRRLGFGQDALIRLMNNVINFINNYGTQSEQLIHAVGVIQEYLCLHIDNNFKVDDRIYRLDESIKNKMSVINPTIQKEISDRDFFSCRLGSFYDFSNSRHTVRSFSDKQIANDTIKKAIKLAQNSPSACNRQSPRIHVFKDNDKINQILNIQGGSRGFGHLGDTLILLTADWNGFDGVRERFAPYVDGGIFGMNLCYALHYYELGSCILNCSINSNDDDRKLRVLAKIPDNEVFIMMILCGHVPSKFMLTSSFRYELEHILKMH